jgi:hypothetical protein
MKRVIMGRFAVVAVCALLVSGCQTVREPGPSMWEYKVLQTTAGRFESELNKMAQDGWIPVTFTQSLDASQGQWINGALLKRLKRP